MVGAAKLGCDLNKLGKMAAIDGCDIDKQREMGSSQSGFDCDDLFCIGVCQGDAFGVKHKPWGC